MRQKAFWVAMVNLACVISFQISSTMEIQWYLIIERQELCTITKQRPSLTIIASFLRLLPMPLLLLSASTLQSTVQTPSNSTVYTPLQDSF
jgi:uncharacterized membrane protein